MCSVPCLLRGWCQWCIFAVLLAAPNLHHTPTNTPMRTKHAQHTHSHTYTHLTLGRGGWSHLNFAVHLAADRINVTQLRAHTHSFFQIHHLQKKVPSRVVILLMLASAHACSQSSNAFTYKHSFLANHHSIMG